MKRRASTQKVKKTSAKKTRVSPASKQMVFSQSKAFTPELKAVDNILTAQPITTGTGAANHVLLLNTMTLGTERFNRVGRRIQMKSAHVRISLYPSYAAGTLPEDIVFMLVLDLEAGATPALTSLLQDVDNVGAVNSTPTSHVNLDNSKRYKILKRKNIPLRGAVATIVTAGASQATQDTLDWSWNVAMNELCQFNAGNTGVIGDIVNGALILCWWSTIGGVAPTSTFDARTRVRYLD